MGIAYDSTHPAKDSSRLAKFRTAVGAGAPIRWQSSIRHKSMKAGMRPLDRTSRVAMFHRIEARVGAIAKRIAPHVLGYTIRRITSSADVPYENRSTILSRAVSLVRQIACPARVRPQAAMGTRDFAAFLAGARPLQIRKQYDASEPFR